MKTAAMQITPTSRAWLPLLPACIFLAILPVTHTVALRLLCLLAAGAVAFSVWWREPPPAMPCKAPLVAWAGIAIASLAWSVDLEYSFGEVLNEVGYPMVAFVAFYVLTGSGRDARLFLRVLVGSVLAVSVFAVVNFVLHFDWSTAGAIGVGDRNAYSTYIVLATPALLLALWERRLDVAPRWALVLTLVFALASGALTLNRTMWPAIGMGAVTFFALRYGQKLRRRQTRLWGAIAVGFVIALSAVQFLAINQWKSRLQGPATTDAGAFLANDPRFKIWNYALERARERPLQGYGFGRGILRREFRDTLGQKLYWHAHNMFLNYAIAVGLPGMLSLVWVLIALAIAFLRLRTAGGDLASPLGAFGIALLVAMLMRSLADDVIVRENSLLFWSLVGMALGLGRRPAPDAVAPLQR